MDTFVRDMPTPTLRRLFSNWEGYQHLLVGPKRVLSLADMRTAVYNYLTEFTTEEGERGDTLRPIVARKDYVAFVNTVFYDQYFLEPLYHTANQGTGKYTL